MARRDLAAVPDRARLELEFDQPYLLGPLFGDYDRHLITIESRLGVHIAARGNKGPAEIPGKREFTYRFAYWQAGKLGIPGIQGVWSIPEAAGWGMTVVSIKQMYAGHAPQVMALAAQCDNAALVIDLLHLSRSGGGVAQRA